MELSIKYKSTLTEQFFSKKILLHYNFSLYIHIYFQLTNFVFFCSFFPSWSFFGSIRYKSRFDFWKRPQVGRRTTHLWAFKKIKAAFKSYCFIENKLPPGKKQQNPQNSFLANREKLYWSIFFFMKSCSVKVLLYFIEIPSRWAIFILEVKK